MVSFASTLATLLGGGKQSAVDTVGEDLALTEGDDEARGNDDNADNEEDTTNEDDDPRLSSAALCMNIWFHGGDDTNNGQADSNGKDGKDAKDGGSSPVMFGPEFTHQCFDGEHIPGFAPFPQDVEEKRQKILQHQPPEAMQDGSPPPEHASFAHHHNAHSFLRIHIQVAPSARRSKVVLERQSKHKDGNAIQNGSNANIQNGNHKKRKNMAPPANAAKKAKLNGNTDTNDEIRHEGFTETQIRQALAKMLPPMDDHDNMDNNKSDDDSIANDYITAPPGRVVREYSRNNHNTPHHFIATLADGRAVADFHNPIQPLALPYIEAADAIDLTYQPHGGSYWQVLYVFQRKQDEESDGKTGESEHGSQSQSQSHQYALVGYMTLWTVTSPLHKPTAGRIWRVTQALILPPFQKQGHGSQMMRILYDLARAENEGLKESTTNEKSWTTTTTNDQTPSSYYPIVQINVEDPAEGFEAMRNAVDLSYLTETDEWRQALEGVLQEKTTTTTGNRSTTNGTNGTNGNNASFLSMEPKVTAAALETYQTIATASLLTVRQVHIVHELLQWRALYEPQAAAASSSNNNNLKESPHERAYRWRVKARLYQENKAAIAGLGAQDEDMMPPSSSTNADDKKRAMQQALEALYQDTLQQYTKIIVSVKKKE